MKTNGIKPVASNAPPNLLRVNSAGLVLRVPRGEPS